MRLLRNKGHQRLRFSSDKSVLISLLTFLNIWKGTLRIWLQEIRAAHISIAGLQSMVRKRESCYLWRSVQPVCGISKLLWEWGQRNPGLGKGQNIIYTACQNCSVFKGEMEAKGGCRFISSTLQYACLRNKHWSCTDLKKKLEFTVEKLEKASERMSFK